MKHYEFKNGDTICVGTKTYQCLNGELVRVADFIPVGEHEHHYIEPGESFTYEIK